MCSHAEARVRARAALDAGTAQLAAAAEDAARLVGDAAATAARESGAVATDACDDHLASRATAAVQRGLALEAALTRREEALRAEQEEANAVSQSTRRIASHAIDKHAQSYNIKKSKNQKNPDPSSQMKQKVIKHSGRISCRLSSPSVKWRLRTKACQCRG